MRFCALRKMMPSVAIPGFERGPSILRRDRGRLLRALVRHLEEQQVGELFDEVAVAEAVVAQDVAVVPQLLDELLGVVAHASRSVPSACIRNASAQKFSLSGHSSVRPPSPIRSWLKKAASASGA